MREAPHPTASPTRKFCRNGRTLLDEPAVVPANQSVISFECYNHHEVFGKGCGETFSTEKRFPRISFQQDFMSFNKERRFCGGFIRCDCEQFVAPSARLPEELIGRAGPGQFRAVQVPDHVLDHSARQGPEHNPVRTMPRQDESVAVMRTDNLNPGTFIRQTLRLPRAAKSGFTGLHEPEAAGSLPRFPAIKPSCIARPQLMMLVLMRQVAGHQLVITRRNLRCSVGTTGARSLARHGAYGFFSDAGWSRKCFGRRCSVQKSNCLNSMGPHTPAPILPGLDRPSKFPAHTPITCSEVYPIIHASR